MVSSSQLPVNRQIQPQFQTQPLSLQNIKPGADHEDPRYLQAEKWLYSMKLDLLESGLVKHPYEVSQEFGMSLIEAMTILVKTPYTLDGGYDGVKRQVFEHVMDGLIILAQHHPSLEHLTLLFQGHDRIIELANKGVVFPMGSYFSGTLELDVAAGLFFDLKILKQFFQSQYAELAIKNAGLCQREYGHSDWFDLRARKSGKTLADIACLPQQMLVDFTNSGNMSLIHVLLLKYLHAKAPESQIAAELISQLLASRFKHFHQSDEGRTLNQRLVFALASFSFKSVPGGNSEKQEWLRQLFFHFFNMQELSFKNDTIHHQYYGRQLTSRDYTRHIIEVTALIANHHDALKGAGMQNAQHILEQLAIFKPIEKVLPTLSLFVKTGIARRWLYQQFTPGHDARMPDNFAHARALPEFVVESQSPLVYALYYKGKTIDEKCHGQCFSVEFWNELKDIRQSESFAPESPLVHQALFFTGHDKHLDIEIKEELREAFIHQLMNSGKTFFCLDNTTYEHWFSSEDSLPSFISNCLTDRSIMIVDESTLGPQAREFLNGVKDMKHLQQRKGLYPLLIVSLVTPGSRRTAALTSRSIQISERDFTLDSALNVPKKHTFDGLPQISEANRERFVLDVENMDDLSEALNRLLLDARYSVTPEIKSLVITNVKKSLTFFQLCALAEKLNISLELLNRPELPALQPFQGSRLQSGYFVDRNSFAQVFESQISIENGVLASDLNGPLHASLKGKNALEFQTIHALDQLSQEQLHLLQQYQSNPALPEVQVFQLGQQIADVSGLKTVDVKNNLSVLPSRQQVSLWHTSGVFDLKSFRGFKLSSENCLWLHGEDQFSQLNMAIEPIEGSKQLSDTDSYFHSDEAPLYRYAEGRLRELLQNPEIQSGRMPLFIIGLDRLPELQPHFLSFFVKDAYMGRFGTIEFLRTIAPDARIHCIVSEPLMSLPLAHYSGRLVSSSGLLPSEFPEAWPGFSKLTPLQQSPWKEPASNAVSRNEVFKTLAKAYVDPKQRAITLLGGISSGKRSLIDAAVTAARDQSLTLDAGLWGQPQFFEILEQWATQNRAQVRIPLILENATTQTDWSLFRDIFSDTPSIRIRGRHYRLTSRHLLIAKGHLPATARSHYVQLLAEESFAIQVPQITDPELLSEVINPILNAYPQLHNEFKKELRQDLFELHRNAELILGPGAVTARQLETIAIHAVALVARSHRYEIERDMLDRSVSPLEPLQLLVKTQYMSRAGTRDKANALEMYLNESPYLFRGLAGLRIAPHKSIRMANTRAVQTILEILNLVFDLRQDLTASLLKSAQAGFPNTRCLIFAGLPGIGKDKTVREFLKSNIPDFSYLNANQDLDWTLKQILTAAEKGYPVVVSEADLMAHIFEGIASGVLQGTLPNGKPVHPGFMLILTINGTALVGREQFTASFLNRSLLVNLPELNAADLDRLNEHHTFKDFYGRRDDLHSAQERLAFYYPDLKLKLGQIPPRIVNKILIELRNYNDPETVRRWYDLDQYAVSDAAQESQGKSQQSALTLTEILPEPFDLNQLKPKDWIAVSRQYAIEWPVAKPRPDRQGYGQSREGGVPAKAAAAGTFAYNMPFQLSEFGNPEDSPQIGAIINDYDHQEILNRARYLVESASDSKGNQYSLQGRDLIELPLDMSCMTRIGYHVSLNDARDYTPDRHYKALQLLLPLEFGPVPDSVTLKMALGQQECTVKGGVISDQDGFVHGIFDQEDILAAQQVLDKGQNRTQLIRLSLQYRFAPVIRQEPESGRGKSKKLESVRTAISSESRTGTKTKSSGSRSGKTGFMSRLSGHKTRTEVKKDHLKSVGKSADAGSSNASSKLRRPRVIQNPELFDRLPDEMKTAVMTINNAVVQHDAGMTGSNDRAYRQTVAQAIKTEIDRHRQITLYPIVEDPALDAEYASSELVSGDLEASQAMTYFTLRRGQCTHAAQAWNWLFKTFTDLDVKLVSSFVNQSKERRLHRMKGGHSLIAVTIGHEPVLFDPTTFRTTTELYTPQAQDDLSQVFQAAQHEAVNAGTSGKVQSKEETQTRNSSVTSAAAVPFELAYRAPRTLNFLLQREQRLLTFNALERQIFDQLLKPVLKDLEQLVTGKGVSFTSSGDTIAPHRIGKTKSIFAKASIRTQTGYKHVVIREFEAEAQSVLLQPMFIQALINAGVRIHAPTGDHHQFKELVSAEDLFRKPRFKNLEVPAQLQGENAVIIDSFNAAFSKSLQILGSRLQQEYARQHQKPEIMVAALTARHLRGWMLKPFTGIHNDVNGAVKNFNPKQPIKALPVSVMGIRPDVGQIIKMAGVYEL